jgi:hypothetical protein
VKDGTDDTFCSPEPLPVAESREGVGRAVAVQSGGNSPGDSSLSDSPINDARDTSEWDSYVDSQIRNSWPDLGIDEQAFCDEYLDNGYKHREAALAVERPANSGIKLLNKPLCREYIVWNENKRRQRRVVSERFFDAQLTELYDKAIGEVEVPLVTGSGVCLEAKKFNGGLALQIIQERAKISGITKPEMAELGVTVVLDMAALTGTKVVSEQ